MKKTVRTIELSWENESHVMATRRMTVVKGRHIPAEHGSDSNADPDDVVESEIRQAEIAQGGDDERD